MMLHIPDVLTRQQVTAIRTAIDAADWVDGRATAGSQGARVKRNRQLPEDSPVALEQGRTIEQALAANALYFSAALPARTMSPLFNRYADSETYGLHVDGAARRLPGAQQWMRTDVSCTLFLCDPEDYDGGELVVVDTYGTHEVKLPAGDLILYPASSLHRVEPVTRGARISSFFWIQSLVRQDAQRALLFDMDVAIQRLAGQVGANDPSLVALTGTYHNLLRMWSEV